MMLRWLTVVEKEPGIGN